MPDEVILTNVSDKVATLTFNRPDKLNALSMDLIAGSIEMLKAWAAIPMSDASWSPARAGRFAPAATFRRWPRMTARRSSRRSIGCVRCRS